jgi:hypothetical protein
VEFRHIFEARDANILTSWFDEAERSELHSLGVSLRRDREAVRAAIPFQRTNGQVEGQANRLKFVKRTMYGRANFPLLRPRVLAARVTTHGRRTPTDQQNSRRAEFREPTLAICTSPRHSRCLFPNDRE